jgi:hypothetical protein
MIYFQILVVVNEKITFLHDLRSRPINTLALSRRNPEEVWNHYFLQQTQQLSIY